MRVTTKVAIRMLVIVAAIATTADVGAGAGDAGLKSRVVHTKQGAMRGTIVTPRSSSFASATKGGKLLRPVEAFVGVRYATPPVGELRFMPPVTVASWRGIRTVDTPMPDCPHNLHYNYRLFRQQRGFATNDDNVRDEDCLFLNIYSPARGKYLAYTTLLCLFHYSAKLFGSTMHIARVDMPRQLSPKALSHN